MTKESVIILVKGSKELIKQLNSLGIFRVIRESGAISRADIAKSMALNPATVSSNTKFLLEQGLIKEVGIGNSTGGRKPVMYRINDRGIYTIGIFINVDYVSCGLISLTGDVITDKKVFYGEDITFDEVMDIVYDLIRDIYDYADIEGSKVLGIGIGIHGLADHKNGRSIYSPALNWKDRDITKGIIDEFNLPTFMDNDCRVMALGEKWFGHGRHVKDFVLLHIDKGVGTGIILDSKLFRGSSFSAGEIGHINIFGQDRTCKCGKKGCLEALISEYGICSDYKVATGNDSSLEDIISLYEEEKVEVIGDIFKGLGANLGYGISMISNLLDPELIVLAGRVPDVYDFIKDEVENSFNKYGLRNKDRKPSIRVSNIQENIGVVGAGTLVMEMLLNDGNIL